jgi:putative autotransporter adhesin-like protein
MAMPQRIRCSLKDSSVIGGSIARPIIRAVLVLIIAAPTADVPARELAQEQRAVSDFDRVVLHGVGELMITQTDQETLRVEAEARLLPKITSEVRSGVLHLGFSAREISTQYPIRFHLTVKRLTALQSEGSANITAGELQATSMRLTLTGSGYTRIDSLTVADLTVKLLGSADFTINDGSASAEEVTIDGSGEFKATKFVAAQARVIINGSGSATLAVDKFLSAIITGSGTIRYSGNPKVERVITGAGRVSQLP